MSMSHDDAFAPELLDFHLNRLTPGQREIWRARIAADPKLAEQDEALGSLFKTLGSWHVEPAPADLPARIAARIAGAGQPLQSIVELNPPSADRSEPLLRRVIDDIKGRPGRGLGGKILPGRNTCHPSLEGDSR